jgi:cell division protein FtsA
MFPKKSQILAGLDVGTSKVSVVIAEDIKDQSSLNIIGIGTAPSKGLRKGVVINIEATVESILAALKEAEEISGVEVKNVTASISGNHIKGANSHGVVGIRNRDVKPVDIDAVIDAARAVAIPMDREIIHVLPQQFIIDDQDGIKDPLGIAGVRLEARVHLVTCAVASTQNIVKCAQRCNLNVEDIVISSLASSKAVLSPEEMDLGVCVVDIGAGTSDIIIYYKGSVCYTSVIGVGGDHISADISTGLRTPLHYAEEIKCQYGSAVASDIESALSIEVVSTGERGSKHINSGILGDIIESRVYEIFGLIHEEIECSGYARLLGGGVVITGGCSNLKSISVVAEKVLGTNVRLGVPKNFVDLADSYKTPFLSTSVGLTIFSTEQNIASRLYLNKSSPGKFLKMVGNWIGSNF